jgi:hypothetical protein
VWVNDMGDCPLCSGPRSVLITEASRQTAALAAEHSVLHSGVLRTVRCEVWTAERHEVECYAHNWNTVLQRCSRVEGAPV